MPTCYFHTKTIKCFSLFLLLILSVTAHSQFVEQIQEWDNSYIPIDGCSSPDGGFYVAGDNSGYPLLIRFDKNGNVLWEKTYTDSMFTNDWIYRAVSDSTGVYLLGSKNQYPNGNWVMKVDTSGNIVWFNESVKGYRNSTNADNYIDVRGNKIYVVYFISGPDYIYMVDSYDSSTGTSISSDTICALSTDSTVLAMTTDDGPITTPTGWLFYNNRNGIVKVDTTGEYDYQYLGDSIPGTLIGENESEIWAYVNAIKGYSNPYNLYESELICYDSNWQELNRINLFPDSLRGQSGGYYQQLVDVVDLDSMGMLMAGTYVWDYASGTSYKFENFIYQLDQESNQIINSSTDSIDGYGIIKLIQTEKSVYGIGQWGYFGLNVYRISPTPIPATGISPVTNPSKITWRVYPNPSSGTVRIQSDDNIETVRVYNLQGALLIERRVIQNEEELKLPDSGVYIIEVEDNQNRVSQMKLINQ